jgi:hypothetical protein
MPGEKEVGSLTITPGGQAGNITFVKIDASIHIESVHSGADMRLWLVRDGSSGDRSLEQRFALAAYGGSPSALTWVVELPSGVPETLPRLTL